MYTVEYEELRPALDGKGNLVDIWFPVVETFRTENIDDPQTRAVDRINQLCCNYLDRIRGISLVAWKVQACFDVAVEYKGRHVGRI